MDVRVKEILILTSFFKFKIEQSSAITHISNTRKKVSVFYGLFAMIFM